jgi:hypothetical protein
LKVVLSSRPSSATTVDGVNPDPEIDKVTDPTGRVAGRIVSAGRIIGIDTTLLVENPGSGFETLTFTIPLGAEETIVAEIWPVSMNLVSTGIPLTRTCDCEMKPLPANEIGVEREVMLLGVAALRTGIGFSKVKEALEFDPLMLYSSVI